MVGRNSYNQPIYEWRERPALTGASLQNPNSVVNWDPTGGVVTTEVVLYAEPDADVLDADRLTVRGKVYTVQGHLIPEVNVFTGHRGMKAVKLKA